MKQTVIYNRSMPYENIQVGENARVYPLTHQSNLVSNVKVARTSTVLAVDGGVFITLNSIYIPVKCDTASSLKTALEQYQALEENAIMLLPVASD